MDAKVYVVVLKQGSGFRFWREGEKFSRRDAMRLAKSLRHRLPPIADKVYARKKADCL